MRKQIKIGLYGVSQREVQVRAGLALELGAPNARDCCHSVTPPSAFLSFLSPPPLHSYAGSLLTPFLPQVTLAAFLLPFVLLSLSPPLALFLPHAAWFFFFLLLPAHFLIPIQAAAASGFVCLFCFSLLSSPHIPNTLLGHCVITTSSCLPGLGLGRVPPPEVLPPIFIYLGCG